MKALDRACLVPAEWRSGVAGHLILSDEDVTSEIQGLWRRLNTLQHYKVGGAGAERGWGARGGGGLAAGSPTVVSRSLTEQLWPWYPVSPSTSSGKARITCQERVSTHPPAAPPCITVLCPWFVRCPVMGGGPLGLRVGFPSTRWGAGAPTLLGVGRTPGA